MALKQMFAQEVVGKADKFVTMWCYTRKMVCLYSPVVRHTLDCASFFVLLFWKLFFPSLWLPGISHTLLMFLCPDFYCFSLSGRHRYLCVRSDIQRKTSYWAQLEQSSIVKLKTPCICHHCHKHWSLWQTLLFLPVQQLLVLTDPIENRTVVLSFYQD